MELEEEFRRDRVKSILQSLSALYKKFFNEELDPSLVKAIAEAKIVELKQKIVEEAIGHLYSKSDYNPIDLYRLLDILNPPKPTSEILIGVKRGRPRRIEKSE